MKVGTVVSIENFIEHRNPLTIEDKVYDGETLVKFKIIFDDGVIITARKPDNSSVEEELNLWLEMIEISRKKIIHN